MAPQRPPESLILSPTRANLYVSVRPRTRLENFDSFFVIDLTKSFFSFGTLEPFHGLFCWLLQVIIITNSDEGWVEFSAQRYCPSLLPVLSKYPIISARTRYEKFYPCQPLCWKAAAFAHEVNEIYDSLKNADDTTSCASMEGTEVSSTSSLSDTSSMEEEYRTSSSSPCDVAEQSEQPPRQIISFGDSNEERMAVSIVSGQLDAVPKSIKFMASPSLLQIIGQLHLLTNHMQFVCESTKSLDMHITTEQADQYAQTYLRRENLAYDETIVPAYVPRTRKGLNYHRVRA